MNTIVIKRKTAAIIAALSITTFSLIGFGSGFIAGKDSMSSQILASNRGNNVELVKTSVFSSDQNTDEMTIPEIVTLAENSVVEITTETAATDPRMGQYITSGAGSGVIISDDGYIVTNHHVIEGANKITVRLKSGISYIAALSGTDSKTDIAVLKIDATGLNPVVYGDSSSLKVGELAVVIGNPLGQLGGTVTDGIISALDREIELDNATMNLLQTNAAINPGNSGGGLFNGRGELIGIVVAKSSGNNIEGLGFAIPINDITSVIDQIIDYGYVQGRIDLGMTLIDISNTQAAMLYGVQKTGVYIQKVTDHSDAKKAGFQSGDRITAINGIKTSTLSELNKQLDQCKVGSTIQVEITRGQQSSTLSLILGEYKPSS